MNILISKSKCRIEPKPNSILSDVLDRELSYKKQGARFMPNPQWGIVHLYSIKTATFPIGYLNEVINIIKQYYEYKNIKDELNIICGNNCNSVEINVCPPKTSLRDYQLEAVETFLSHKRGILALATGLGKTLTALHIIHKLKVRTLVITHTTELLNQWCKVIKKELDYDCGKYYGRKKEIKNITVTSIQTLYKSKEILKDFDFIIIDECHHISADMMYRTGLELEQKYILGLSATPYRSDGEDMKIKAIAGDIIFRKNIKYGIESGYLCPAEVKWLEIKDDIEIERYESYPDVYDKKIVYNDIRNKTIVEEVLKYIGKVLILVSRIEHGEKLLELLKDRDVVFIQGSTIDKDTNHQIIIATSIFDEGLDIPDINVVVLAGGGKSSVTTVQRIGRGLRTFKGKDKVIIIDFIETCKYLKNHYNLRKKVYEEELC